MSPTAPPSLPAGAVEAAPRSLLRDDWRLHFALISLFGFAVRLVYLAQTRHWVFFEYPVLDAGSQYRWAQTAVQTQLWIGNDAVLSKAPLYTYFLAFNVWIFGATPAAFWTEYSVELARPEMNMMDEDEL